VAPQGVAAREPARAHPDAPGHSVQLDRFTHVVGAGGIKPAGTRKEGRQANLINSKQPEDERGGGREGRRIRLRALRTVHRAFPDAAR